MNLNSYQVFDTRLTAYAILKECTNRLVTYNIYLKNINIYRDILYTRIIISNKIFDFWSASQTLYIA